ncbi:MAG: hypothetical protein QXP01_00785 [Candidatus Hadarchaeum sp.]
MKTAKVMMLAGLLAGVVLLVEAHTQSFYSFHLEEIEILPSEPSPTDDVEIKITGWLPTPCDPGVSFSDLQQSREGDQITFWATAMTQVPEPTICIQLAVPVFHSYRVGKLEPGNYDFVLYACIGENDVCESGKTVLARKEFAVTIGPELPQVRMEVIPAHPVTTDDVSIQVTVIDRCTFSFSDELMFAQTRNLFLATIESMGCSIIPIEPPHTFTSSHTYHLGRLPAGEYEFQLQWCTPYDSIGRVIDKNKSCSLDDDEILWAINLWISGANVPGTSQIIDDATILRLIDVWITQTRVCCLLFHSQKFQVTLAPSPER